MKQRKESSLHLRTTPKLLSIFDQCLPGHQYQTIFPYSILSDERLALHNLQDLLQGSSIYYAPKPEKAHNPVYERYMTTLRRAMDERDYQDMIEAKSSSVLAETRVELRSLKNQLSTIVNVLISIFTAAMAAWFWTPSWRISNRVIACLAAAVVLGAIETFLYLRYLQKIEQSRRHEAGKTAKSRVKHESSQIANPQTSRKKNQ